MYFAMILKAYNVGGNKITHFWRFWRFQV